MDMPDLKERLSQLSVEIGRGRPVTDLRLLTAPIDAVAEIERLRADLESCMEALEQLSPGWTFGPETLCNHLERLRSAVAEYLDVLDNAPDESETSTLRELVAELGSASTENRTPPTSEWSK